MSFDCYLSLFRLNLHRIYVYALKYSHYQNNLDLTYIFGFQEHFTYSCRIQIKVLLHNVCMHNTLLHSTGKSP